MTMTVSSAAVAAAAHRAGDKPPKYVVFADALPKNPSGQILKKDLRVRRADIAQS